MKHLIVISVILFFLSLFTSEKLGAENNILSFQNQNHSSSNVDYKKTRMETSQIFLTNEDNSGSFDNSKDDIRLSPFDQKRLKSPTKAFIIAAIPGFFAHGLGHFYAQKPKTGRMLLGIQGAGMLFTFLGWVAGYGPWLVEETSHAEEKIKIGKGLFYSGITFFAGSWVYDMIGSPLQAKNYNKEIIKRYELGFKLQPQKNEIKLILTKNF